jgi:hypothetical protein
MTARAARPPPLALRVLAMVSVVLVLLGGGEGPASAESRVEFLASRLRFPPTPGQADDFRVRTNAALALGATNDDSAIAPLCDGLDDPSEVVRQAVAVAMKRLARTGALDCLRRRAAVEASAAVKEQIRKAIDASGGSAAAAPAAPSSAVADAKYYVSVSHVTNGTSRPGADVDRIIRGAIASRLSDLGEYQLAPPAETGEAAKAVLAKRKLKGYYLSVSVEKLDYSDGNLRVRVKIAVFSYPAKDLRGEIPAAATLPGARPGDTAAEDQLMSAVAARAAELFAQNFR